MRNKISKVVVSFMLILTLGSCRPEPIKNYGGGIVRNKYGGDRSGYSYRLELDGKFVTVYVTEFDFGKYNICDTIK